MNNYINKLQAYLDQNPIKYVDGDSLLEQLYWCYFEANTFGDLEIRKQFHRLYNSMPELSEERFDEVFSYVSSLSALQEKHAFQVGVKIGLRLVAELMA